jgi:hypothetical protein
MQMHAVKLSEACIFARFVSANEINVTLIYCDIFTTFGDGSSSALKLLC